MAGANLQPAARLSFAFQIGDLPRAVGWSGLSIGVPGGREQLEVSSANDRVAIADRIVFPCRAARALVARASDDRSRRDALALRCACAGDENRPLAADRTRTRRRIRQRRRSVALSTDDRLAALRSALGQVAWTGERRSQQEPFNAGRRRVAQPRSQTFFQRYDQALVFPLRGCLLGYALHQPRSSPRIITRDRSNGIRFCAFR